MTMNLPQEVEDHFSRGDLVAAIAQDASTGEVLMMAWMNSEALQIGAEVVIRYGSRVRVLDILRN